MTLSFAAAETAQTNGQAGDKRPRKSAAVFQDLKRKIITGELTPECPMTEQALAAEYGCSQSTIREALMLLQEGGLVVRRGYQGTYVTDPSLNEALLLLRMRIDIETAGAAEAARNMTPCMAETLRDLDTHFQEAREGRDLFACAEIDRHFHLQIFRLADMPALEPILVRTSMMLQRVLLPNPISDSTWSSKNRVTHAQMICALEEKDGQKLAKMTRFHILSSAVQLAPDFYGSSVEGLMGEG